MSVVTVGTFDGVHAGHRALIADARRQADTRDERLVAVTFSPRPDVALGRTPRPLPDLCSISERVRRLLAAGAHEVEVLDFTVDLMRESAASFVNGLRKRHAMSLLCVGPDFRCGHGGEGDVATLRSLGVPVRTPTLVRRPRRQVKISSSSIRRAVADGIPVSLALNGWAPVLGPEPVAEAS